MIFSMILMIFQIRDLLPLSPIYTELLNENYKVSYSPGGATQNTIRVAQYYLDETESTSFVGCIG